MAFDLHFADSIDSAISLLQRLGPDAHLLAGGTDLIIQTTRGRKHPRHLVDLSNIKDLTFIREQGDEIAVGALTTHRAIERDPIILSKCSALAEACRLIGGVQVRHRASIGGNIANASPAADAVVSLVALGAELILKGPSGVRRMPAVDFLIGPGRTARSHAELVAEIRIPQRPFEASSFLKAGRRKAMEISVVCVASYMRIDPGTRNVVAARISMGSVAPTVMRARKAEEHLLGKSSSAALFQAAAQIASTECSPLTDVRASAEYRRMLVATLVGRTLERCSSRLLMETP